MCDCIIVYIGWDSNKHIYIFNPSAFHTDVLKAYLLQILFQTLNFLF